jgi:hypothetical protein
VKYIGKLEMVLLIRVILPPLDKYIIFQLASHLSIFSTTLYQIDLAFKEAHNGRPKYFTGKEKSYSPECPPIHPHSQHYPLEPIPI